MPHGFVTFARCRFGEASKVAPVDKLSVVLVAIFALFFLASAQLQENGWAYSWSEPESSFWDLKGNETF